MGSNLHYNSTSSQLVVILKKLMAAKEFNAFRLVGGTALSLHRGHRESVDIDLFTDAPYDSIDFRATDTFLRKTFSYVDTTTYKVVGQGQSYFIGASKYDSVKLDLFYTDPFIQEFLLIDGIRMATIEDIIAMKIDVISQGGRKKDFWDINELKDDYSIEKMLDLHKQRNPYTHEEDEIRSKFLDFKNADTDFDPICLKGKHWEIIKLDMIYFAKKA